MLPNHRGAGGVVWLIFFSCFADHLIGSLLDYFTVEDLCNIFEFCKLKVQDWFPHMRAVFLIFLFFDDKFSMNLGNDFDFCVILFPLLID